MKRYPFDQVVVDVTSHFRKIKQEEYLAVGKYRIVDQGKEFIAGYINNHELISKFVLPVIVFGDHTKTFKYVDFPMVLGADGTKALFVKDDIADVKFLYYYFKTIVLPNAGYSRHYKFLKTINIPLPENRDDQIRIAIVLTRAEKLIAKRKEIIRLLDELLKSAFMEIFGDPVRNEKGWEQVPHEKIVTNIASGTSYGGDEKKVLDNDELGVLKISAVTQGVLNPNEFKAVKKKIITKKIIGVKKGMFLFSRANTKEMVAACCIVDRDYPFLFLPDKLWTLTIDEKLINPSYLNFLFKNEKFRNVLRERASGGHESMLNISMRKFWMLKIPLPPLQIQNQFAAIVEKVEVIKTKYNESLIELENLYASLSQRAFKGELDLSRVPIEKPARDAAF